MRFSDLIGLEATFDRLKTALRIPGWGSSYLTTERHKYSLKAGVKVAFDLMLP
jgi:hypothetical protein